ncbi:Dehydration-responsive protein RD22 [Striga hermonthica]|uniref:Dehydration-responsive protein RD22 n=1 Tax=Striga hermonthica TaxID=68872 RepID=A0A9N7NN26_STRHE|nr:Dehydration-responsive protein RD22 [Striga hermonthica]
MELYSLSFLTMLSLIIAAPALPAPAAEDNMSPLDYWKSKLPYNTTAALSDLLYGPTSDWLDNITIRYAQYSKYNPKSGHPHDIKTAATAFFFLEDDLRHAVGRTFRLKFGKSTAGAKFLPRRIADGIPFSAPHVLNLFNMDPRSDPAREINTTINDCRDPRPVKGEKIQCVTSLEGMIDFTTSQLGKHVTAVWTNGTSIGSVKEFKVSGVKSVLSGSSGGGRKILVVCHRRYFPYGVFQCHRILDTVAYEVTLEDEPAGGVNGTRVDAVATCHRDTSGWNPSYVAFQSLRNEKPGGNPICHFLRFGDIAWMPTV